MCNGSNNTPDLRDKFVIGAGNKYEPMLTGGAEQIILQSSNLPSNALSSLGSSWIISGNYNNYSEYSFGNTTTYEKQWYTRTSGGGGENMQFMRSLSNILTSSGWNNVPIDIKPPYFALAYIMNL